MKLVLNQKSWLWLVIAAAVLVRLPFLSGSFWLDEAAQAMESARPFSQQFQIAEDFQPPLYHLVVHALAQFSHQEWWLRLSSLVPGVLTVWLTFVIARRHVSQSASLLSASAVAFSSLLVFFSQELRPYSLAVFWAVMSWNFFEQKSWRWLAVSLTAGLYTSYVFLFWPIGLLAIALNRRALLQTFRAVSVSGILFLAWLPGLLQQLRVGSALRATLPAWEQAVSYTQMKALLLTAAKFLVGPVLIDFALVDIFFVGGALLLLVLSTISVFVQSAPQQRKKIGETVALLALPVLAAWVFSFFIPVIQPKRVLYLFPAAAVLIGWLWERKSILTRVAIVAFFAWQAVALGSYWFEPELQREDWRTVVAGIEERFSPENTAVVFAFAGPFAPWSWYNQEPFTSYSTGLSPITDIGQLELRLSGIERFRYIIVFDYLRDLTDPFRLIEAYLGQREYQELGIYQYPNIGSVRVFEQNRLYAKTAYEPS